MSVKDFETCQAGQSHENHALLPVLEKKWEACFRERRIPYHVYSRHYAKRGILFVFLDF